MADIYTAIICLLYPDGLYSPTSIPSYGQSHSVHPFGENGEENKQIAWRMRLKLKRLANKHQFPPEGDGLLSIQNVAIVPAWYGARWQKALGAIYPAWRLLNPYTVYSPAAIAAILRPGEEADLDFYRQLAPPESDGRSGEASLYCGWRWLLEALKPAPEITNLEFPNAPAFISISCLIKVLRTQGHVDLANKLELYDNHADHVVNVSSVLRLCSIAHHLWLPKPTSM